MFLTDKSPLPHPNLISPAFPSVFLRLLVSENSAAVKEEKLLLKTFTPSVFSTEGFFLYPHAILFPCGCMLFISTSSVAFPLTASAFSDSSLPVERQSDLEKLF